MHARIDVFEWEAKMDQAQWDTSLFGLWDLLLAEKTSCCLWG